MVGQDEFQAKQAKLERSGPTKVQLAGKDEFEAKQAELEGVVSSMMTNLYPGAGGGDMPGGMPGVVSMMLQVPVG